MTDQIAPATDTTASPIDVPAEQATPTTATVTVPVEHAALIERAVKLLERGEQWIVDNIHAGVTTLEGLLSDKNNN